MPTADDLSILFLTLRVAALATLLVLPAGIAAAFALARWRGPGRSLVETALALPLVLPPPAIGLLLLELLARQGPLGRLLGATGIEVVFTVRAAVLAAAVMAFPLLVRSARTAFEEIDPRLISLARTLGKGRLATFAGVSLPLAWRGILSGVLLAFARALGEFGATILVAGNIPGRTQTLALAIFQRTQAGRNDEALRLVGLTVAIAFAAVWTTELVTRRRWRRFSP